MVTVTPRYFTMVYFQIHGNVTMLNVPKSHHHSTLTLVNLFGIKLVKCFKKTKLQNTLLLTTNEGF